MLRLIYSTLACGLLAVLMLGVPSAGAAQTDERAGRLVVVGGALTEIVYQLGEGARVVGVDTTSQWPAQATRLPQVGYQRSLAAEGILSLAPDMVLVSDEAGPPEVLRQIREAGVRLERVKADKSAAGLMHKVRRVAQLLGRGDDGERLVADLQAQMRALSEQVARYDRRPSVAFLLSVGRGGNLVSGHGTAADAAIALAGGRNALAAYAGYKPVNAEAMVAAAPQVLLTTQRSLREIGGLRGLLELPGVALTPAAKSGRIETMDALILLGFGPRTPSALRELAARLHGEPATTAGVRSSD
jgi:iron complex transport system substrate-binding protein